MNHQIWSVNVLLSGSGFRLQGWAYCRVKCACPLMIATEKALEYSSWRAQFEAKSASSFSDQSFFASAAEGSELECCSLESGGRLCGWMQKTYWSIRDTAILVIIEGRETIFNGF